MSERLYPLIVVVGPTGSGKTSLSLALARRWPAEIVSCDSVAVYREFEIGTAKPSREDQAQVPHHMIDVASPADEMTAGEYARQARAALNEIKSRGKLPIVVGGTGLYLKALVEGLFPGLKRSEELRVRLRAIAQKKGVGHLHRILRRLDPRAADKIHANDEPKLIRAIEVSLSARAPMSEVLSRDPLRGFRTLSIGLDPDRTALYERINQRCAQMFSNGLVEETRELLAHYPQLLSRPNSPLNALGYKQAVRHIKGELPLADAISEASQSHRNYAKRQLTWFRNQHQDVQWLNGFGDDAPVRDRAIGLLSDFFA